MTLPTENLPGLPTGVYNPGGALTADCMEEKLLHSFPLPPPLLPELEFVLSAQLRRNLLQQEVHAGLSPPAETAYERERGEETFRTNPDTPRRLSEGQDGWRPSLANGNNQPHTG